MIRTAEPNLTGPISEGLAAARDGALAAIDRSERACADLAKLKDRSWTALCNSANVSVTAELGEALAADVLPLLLPVRPPERFAASCAAWRLHLRLDGHQAIRAQMKRKNGLWERAETYDYLVDCYTLEGVRRAPAWWTVCQDGGAERHCHTLAEALAWASRGPDGLPF